MLTLRQLQYFTALAELRHFGKAAERCCITQPALSMQIKELEDSLRVQLVVRKRGHISLTADGHAILGRALAVLNTARELQDYARHRSRTLVGELRLGVIPSIAPYLLPKILPRAQSRHPQLRLRVHETLTTPLLRELVDGYIDAVILALPVIDARLAFMEMFDDEFLLARRRGAGKDGAQLVTRESLQNERMLLLNDGHCLRDQALSYCGSIARERLEEFGAASLSTIVQMVANGYGVTLLPELAAECELTDERIEVQRFAPPAPQRTVGIAWCKTSTRARDFVALGRLIADTYKLPDCTGRREHQLG